jgi:hypothetical protein
MVVIHDHYAFRGNCAFRHFECRRYRALDKQSFFAAQRYRKYHQPECIDQIMLEQVFVKTRQSSWTTIESVSRPTCATHEHPHSSQNRA